MQMYNLFWDCGFLRCVQAELNGLIRTLVDCMQLTRKKVFPIVSAAFQSIFGGMWTQSELSSYQNLFFFFFEKKVGINSFIFVLLKKRLPST